MQGLFNLIIVSLVWFAIVVCTFGVGIIPAAIWGWLVFAGGDKRMDKALAKLADTLMEGEGLIHQGCDCRPFALFSRRQVFEITNSRVIVLQRGLLGGFTMQDFQWKDLQDATVEEMVLPSVCGSTLTFNNSITACITYPPSDVANAMYRIAQKEEQAWDEKRRVRAMEETRAAAGGITLNAGQSAPDQQQSVSSIGDEIMRFKQMLDDGIISDAEFQEMKSKLLSKGNNF